MKLARTNNQFHGLTSESVKLKINKYKDLQKEFCSIQRRTLF